MNELTLHHHNVASKSVKCPVKLYAPALDQSESHPCHANIAAKAEDFDFPCCSIVFAFFNSYTSRSPVNTHIYNKPKTPDSNSICLVKEDPVVGELPPDQPHPLPDLHLSKLDQQQPLLTHLREQTKLHHLHHLLNSSNKALPVQVSLDRWLLPLRIFATNPSPSTLLI